MAVLTFTVVPPAGATSLQALYNALAGVPVMSSGGTTRSGLTLTFAELDLQADAANTGVISYGNSALTATNRAGSLAAGIAAKLGSGAEQSGHIYSIFVLGNGTDKLGVTVLD